MWKQIKDKLKLSDAMKNVAKISGGTMAGQVISMITLPILTRMYGAVVIGNWALFQSIATIVNSFSDMGLTNAIMIEETEEASTRLYTVISTIILIISIITGVVVFIFYSIVPDESGIKSWFIALTILVLVITSQQSQVCYTWLNKKGEYNILMKNPVINQIAIIAIAIPLGLFGLKRYGYYVALIAGQIAMIIHMKRFLPKKMFNSDIDDFRIVFRTRKTFWKYQLPTNLITNIKNQLPTLLIKGLFGSEMLGYYSVSVRILNIPINLLATSIGRVYFHTASEMTRRGEEIGEYTYRNIIKAIKISIIPIIGMMAFGDIALTIFLGKNYEIAGQIFRIVVLQNFFIFLMMASQGVTITLQKQKYAMISCIAQSIGYTIGLVSGAYIFNSIYIGLVLMSGAYISIQIIYFCKLFQVMNISILRYLKSVGLSILLIFSCTGMIRVLLLLLGITNTI